MKLEKLLWSWTKVDILKYLIFKRQWVSIRALESELEWSFPAIKKQVDLLLEAWVIKIDKSNSKWAIYFDESISSLVRKIFLFSLEQDLKLLFETYDTSVERYFLWKVFGIALDIDLVIIYKSLERPMVDKIKEEISDIFKDYFIDMVNVVFMTSDDFQRRYRLADKFVLNLMRVCWP